MNPEIASLFPEEGEVIETENPRRNFTEVNLLLILFLFRLFLFCKNRYIENITKLFVTATLILSNFTNCENPDSEIFTDLKTAHHHLYAKNCNIPKSRSLRLFTYGL